eukprot:TRINITY_DN67857_c0_g1_i1.p1 TRINITY_DN67857_c0_g1~~TRINITY_DN67857_c0_g1_i1.p1  ORF type:complete len:880 (-),score=110.40 TRINITY_DN67857_c0_g1_i1:124-2763(-)
MGDFCALTLPSYVAIRSNRLKGCFYVLYVPLLIAFVVRCVVIRPFVKVIDVSDGLTISLEPRGLSREVLDTNISDLDLEMCTSPFDYHYEIDRQHSIEPTGCMQVCDSNETVIVANGVDVPCEESSSLIKRRSQGIFVTSIRHSQFSSPNLTISSQLFSPYVGNFVFKVSYAMHFVLPATALTQLQHIQGNHLRNVLTVVVKAQRHSAAATVQEIVLPGQDIEFSIDKALQLAGLPAGWLDVPNEVMTADAQSRHPRGRVSGGVIELSLKCDRGPTGMNLKNTSNLNSIWDDSIYAAICVLGFYKVPGLQGVDEFFDFYHPMTGEFRRVRDIGIEFATHVRAVYEMPDVNGFMLYLTSAIVLLGLPQLLIMFLTLHCLGPLSGIYSRVISRPFSVESHVVGMATRAYMCAHTLGDFEDPNSSVTLSEANFKEQLSHVLSTHHELEVGRAKSLINFVYRFLFRVVPEHADVRATTQSLQSSVPEQVSFGQLIEATTRSEPVDFSSIVNLFDIDRRRGPLERMFTPWKVAHEMHQVAHELRQSSFGATGTQGSSMYAYDSPPQQLKLQKSLVDSEPTMAAKESTESSEIAGGTFAAEERNITEPTSRRQKDAAEKEIAADVPIELSTVRPTESSSENLALNAIILSRLDVLATVLHDLGTRVAKLEQVLAGSNGPTSVASRANQENVTTTAAVVSEDPIAVDSAAEVLAVAAKVVVPEASLVDLSTTWPSGVPNIANASLKFQEASVARKEDVSSTLESIQQELSLLQKHSATPGGNHPILPVTNLSDPRLHGSKTHLQQTISTQNLLTEGDTGRLHLGLGPAAHRQEQVARADARAPSSSQGHTLSPTIRFSVRPLASGDDGDVHSGRDVRVPKMDTMHM